MPFGGASSLDLVIRDEQTRSVMSLSLAISSERFIRMQGAVLVPDFADPFVTSLTIESDIDLDREPMPDAGVCEVDLDDGPFTRYGYSSRQLDAVDQYQLWALNVVDEELDAHYRTFAIDDPFPILVIPVVAAVAGFGWVLDRHGTKAEERRLTEATEAAEKLSASGKSAEVKIQAKSRLRLPWGGGTGGTSTIEVKVGPKGR